MISSCVQFMMLNISSFLHLSVITHVTVSHKWINYNNSLFEPITEYTVDHYTPKWNKAFDLGFNIVEWTLSVWRSKIENQH